MFYKHRPNSSGNQSRFVFLGTLSILQKYWQVLVNDSLTHWSKCDHLLPQVTRHNITETYSSVFVAHLNIQQKLYNEKYGDKKKNKMKRGRNNDYLKILWKRQGKVLLVCNMFFYRNVLKVNSHFYQYIKNILKTVFTQV